MSHRKSIIREYAEAFLVAIVLALVVRHFVVEAFKIPSESMMHTLLVGDRLLVNKLVYKWKEPQRGDVIVFKYPENTKRDFIKRLIGFGEEKIEIRNGDIYVNGERVMEDVIKNIYYYNRGIYGGEGDVISVPEGHYFVLGDNSDSSSDSRMWGFVPEENMVGKAFFIFWPLNRMRMIH